MYIYIIHLCIVKGKNVSVPDSLSIAPWRSMGELMYISTFPWPRHQFEAGGQFDAPAAFPPWKSRRYPLDLVGWTSEPVLKIWRSENVLPYQHSNSNLSVWTTELHYHGSPSLHSADKHKNHKNRTPIFLELHKTTQVSTIETTTKLLNL
jgi:hypothetical protein